MTTEPTFRLLHDRNAVGVFRWMNSSPFGQWFSRLYPYGCSSTEDDLRLGEPGDELVLGLLSLHAGPQGSSALRLREDRGALTSRMTIPVSASDLDLFLHYEVDLVAVVAQVPGGRVLFEILETDPGPGGAPGQGSLMRVWMDVASIPSVFLDELEGLTLRALQGTERVGASGGLGATAGAGL